jgi:hypothetical protein
MSKQTTVVFGRDQILAAKPVLEVEQVAVPEWGEGVVVNVRAMTASERDRFEESMKKGTGKNTTVDLSNFRARLCVASIVDEQGVRCFTNADIPALGAQPVKILQRICEVATRLSGLSGEDIDELSGKSETTLDGDSASG